MLLKMRVDKSKLSATRRKLTSAPDNRVKSKWLGISGAMVIGTALGLVILIDVCKILKDLRLFS
jgi:hypothetical protein